MPKKFRVLTAVIAMTTMILSGTALASKAESETEPAKRKIVVFKQEVDEITKENLIKKSGGEKIKDLRLIRGKAVKLTARAEKNLAKEAGVLRIDDDIEVSALSRPAKTNKAPQPQPAEVLPWGIDRIDAELVWGGNTAETVKVGIIDTGIETAHPDLQANVKGGVSAVAYTTSYNDDNGHGTHVAGITAAADNGIGVIGAGPEIDLYAVKVLDRRGSGYLSDVIEGLDWAIQNKMQVVNMSLGTSFYSASFKDAVKKVNAAGIVQVAAAGNAYGGAVTYPAKFPEVIAVSATDSTDNVASFSSVGPEVDLAAPGASIYSTYKGQTYKTLSGTSMASPHVAGVAALVLSVPEKCDIDLNGVCSPAEVQQRLEATTEDLGALGFDNLYGYGLVNAYNAVQP